MKKSILLSAFLFLSTLSSSAFALRPVIILHGFSENGGSAAPQELKRQMLANGLPREWVFTPSMPNSGACIESTADWFGRVVQDVLRLTGQSQVDVIAHSLGGVVVRSYLKRKNAYSWVRNLVTIASPHHGMQNAGFLFFICSSRQVMLNSSFLKDLNTPDETPGLTDYTTIVGTKDQLLRPLGSAHLSGAEQVTVSEADHWGVVSRGKTKDAIYDALFR